MWRWKWRTTNRQPKLSAFLRQQKQKSIQRIFRDGTHGVVFAVATAAATKQLPRLRVIAAQFQLSFLLFLLFLFFCFLSLSLSCGKYFIPCFLNGFHNFPVFFYSPHFIIAEEELQEFIERVMRKNRNHNRFLAVGFLSHL